MSGMTAVSCRDGKRITLFSAPQFADEHQRRLQISGS
jgi:hypothetical protein